MSNLDHPGGRRSKYIEGDLRARRLHAQIIRRVLGNLEGIPSSVFGRALQCKSSQSLLPACSKLNSVSLEWAFAISLPGRE